VSRALLTGVAGGVVHGSGKILSPEFGIAGMALGSVGTSIVANAGRGAFAFDELTLPLGPARFRITRDGPHNVHVAINAYESAILLHRLMQPGMRVDWNRSSQTGAVVLRTAAPLIVADGKRAAGLTAGSVITLSDRAMNPARSFNHERIHVQQEWFLQEIWGRPVENGARARMIALRWIPRWVELGVVTPTLSTLERNMIGIHAPMRSWRESEAEALEDWSRD
jgi:hypothetical protein